VHSPTLNELPPPPPGRAGWPCTEESPVLPDTMPDGRPWPKISVVTPSYNQGLFIEETIRSVLLQGYPNLPHTSAAGKSRIARVKDRFPGVFHVIKARSGGVGILMGYRRVIIEYWCAETELCGKRICCATLESLTC